MSSDLGSRSFEHAVDDQPRFSSLPASFIIVPTSDGKQDSLHNVLHSCSSKAWISFAKREGHNFDFHVFHKISKLLEGKDQHSVALQATLADAISHPRHFGVTKWWIFTMIFNFMLLILVTFVSIDSIFQDAYSQGDLNWNSVCYNDLMKNKCIVTNESFSNFKERFVQALVSRRDETCPMPVAIACSRLESAPDYLTIADKSDVTGILRLLNSSASSSPKECQRLSIVMQTSFVKLWRRGGYWFNFNVTYNLFMEVQWQMTTPVNCSSNLRTVAVPTADASLDDWTSIGGPVALLICALIFCFLLALSLSLPYNSLEDHNNTTGRVRDTTVRSKHFRRWLSFVWSSLLLLSTFGVFVPMLSPRSGGLILLAVMSGCGFVFVLLWSNVFYGVNLVFHVMCGDACGRAMWEEVMPESTDPSNIVNTTTTTAISTETGQQQQQESTGSSTPSQNTAGITATTEARRTDDDESKGPLNDDHAATRIIEASQQALFTPPPFRVNTWSPSRALCYGMSLLFFIICVGDLRAESGVDVHSFATLSNLRPWFIVFQVLFAPSGLELVVYSPQLFAGSLEALPSTSVVTLVYVTVFIVLPSFWVKIPQSFSEIASSILGFFDSLVRYVAPVETSQYRLAIILLLLLLVFLLLSEMQSMDSECKRKSLLVICVFALSKEGTEQVKKWIIARHENKYMVPPDQRITVAANYSASDPVFVQTPRLNKEIKWIPCDDIEIDKSLLENPFRDFSKCRTWFTFGDDKRDDEVNKYNRTKPHANQMNSALRMNSEIIFAMTVLGFVPALRNVIKRLSGAMEQTITISAAANPPELNLVQFLDIIFDEMFDASNQSMMFPCECLTDPPSSPLPSVAPLPADDVLDLAGIHRLLRSNATSDIIFKILEKLENDWKFVVPLNFMWADKSLETALVANPNKVKLDSRTYDGLFDHHVIVKKVGQLTHALFLMLSAVDVEPRHARIRRTGRSNPCILVVSLPNMAQKMPLTAMARSNALGEMKYRLCSWIVTFTDASGTKEACFCMHREQIWHLESSSANGLNQFKLKEINQSAYSKVLTGNTFNFVLCYQLQDASLFNSSRSGRTLGKFLQDCENFVPEDNAPDKSLLEQFSLKEDKP